MLPENVRCIEWNGEDPVPLVSEIAGAGAIVNLAGESIAGLWTKRKRRRITSSRIGLTRSLVTAIRAAEAAPEVLIQASATGYYGSHGDTIIDENSPSGSGFLARVCQDWENEAAPARDHGLRVATIRMGVVLGNGGILDRIAPFFRWCLGGYPGNGKNWIPWIHLDDLLQAITHLIENTTLSGPHNLVSPDPVRAREFYKAIGAVLHRPVLFRMPAFLARIAAGEMARDLLLSSQRVIPRRLIDGEFGFRFGDLRSALMDVLTGTRSPEA